jgi:uncharacterized protein (DUF849 family)
VDCYNAGATVLHLHVRELDGKGSKRLSKFNELIAGVRKAVPEMIIQVGGSISFAPEDEGQAAKWLSDDTRHMLADLDPVPDQVTVTVNTSQMNVTDQAEDADFAGTARQSHAVQCLQGNDRARPAGLGGGARAPPDQGRHPERLPVLQPEQLRVGGAPDAPRLLHGPLVMNWVAIAGGMDTPSLYSLANFVRAVPDGAVLTVESNVRNVLPVNMWGIAAGLHVRCGTEDCLWNQTRTEKASTVSQIEQLVRISREFGRPVATAKEAREISKIGVFYDSVEESLAANGFAPNRPGANQGFLRKTS